MKYPIGVLEDVLMWVGKFFILCDFVLMEMKEDAHICIILARPFLAKIDAMIDVHHNKLSLSRLGKGDGDHHEKPNDHQAQPKGDSTKPQEVKDVALLCWKLLFMAEEVISDSSRKFPVFVCTFGLAQVDPQLEAPHGVEV